jgi:putative transposase
MLGLSRSSVYYKAVPVSAGDVELMRLIDEIHLEIPVLGKQEHP